MNLIQKILPAVLSLAAIIIGIRVLKGHFVTVSLGVITLWFIRSFWRKRRTKAIVSKGGEALIHGLNTDSEKTERWITKAKKVLEDLEKQQAQAGEDTGTELSRSDLIKANREHLLLLQQLRDLIGETRQKLESAILTYRTLMQGHRSEESPPKNSTSSEIRNEITSMEKNIRSFRKTFAKLHGESHESIKISKAMKLLNK